MFAAKIKIIMNRIFTVLAGISLATTTYGQAIVGQVVADSAVTGANYVTDVFYSLNNSTVHSEPRDNWDLGFEITGNSSSILANTQGTARVYQSPFAIANWNTFDTAGYAAWQRLDNSPESWSAGALNSNIDTANGFDLGWGVYDFLGDNGPAHATNGDSIFLVKLANGSFKKLRINRLFSSQYSFTYSDVDGQNEITDTIAKSGYTGKNFGYYNLATATELDREPATADWDLLFTRYITYDYGLAVGSPQAVTGVLLNKNVKAVKIQGVHQDDLVWENYIDSFKTEKNVIGHDWKGVNYAPPPTFLIEDSLTYLVRRPINGEVWKVVFTGFGGSGSGKYFFNKELVLAAPPASATSAVSEACGSVQITANAGNGYTYQWYRGTTLVAGATSATFDATQSGSYSVRVTDRGAFSRSVAVDVVVHSLPTATATSVNPLCAGNTTGSVTVTATGGKGSYTYTWTGTTSTTAQAQNIGAGTYSVVVTDSLGCEAASVSATLTEPTALSATASSTGNSATATPAGGTSPYTYAWSDAGNQTTETATGLANGSYTVIVTDANGCTSTATVTIQISSVEDVSNNWRIAIKPNPSNGQFTLAALHTQPTDVQLQIADVTGRVVFQSFENNTVLNKSIDLSNLNAGIYLLNVQTAFGKTTERIIIR